MILKNTPQISLYRKKLDDAEKETSLNVFTTWELSFQQLQSHSSEEGLEIKILTLFAFFDPKDISERFLADYAVQLHADLSTETSEVLKWLKDFTDDECQWSSVQFEDVLIKLKDLSLLQSISQESDGFYHSTLHPLVKDWIQLRIHSSAYQENTLVATVLLGEIIKRSDRHYRCILPLTLKQTILAHIMTQEENDEIHAKLQSTVPISPGPFEDYLTAREWFAQFLLDIGSYKEGEMIIQRIKTEREIILGPEHSYTLTSMGNLARAYGRQGRWTEAEKLEMQIVDSRKRVLGIEHPDTLTGMSNLAVTYRSQGRLTEAEKLEMQVNETGKRVLGIEHPDTLMGMGNLALTYWDQGKWKEAEVLNMQVIDTRKRVLGIEHPDTLISMSNLAMTYGSQGRWTEAEKLEMQVVDSRKRVLGIEHPNTLITMNNLAHTYRAQCRVVEAIELMMNVVEGCTRVLGAAHPDTMESAEALSDWKHG